MNYKKVMFVMVFLFITLTLSGCRKYEDLVPEEKDLANWDGNYIYYGNKRSKTTGEDTEILIREVEYLNIQYNLFEVSDFIYLNDDIYMIAYMKNKDSISDYHYDSSMLLHYNTKEKTTAVIYFSNNQDEFIDNFFHTTEDFFIISRYDYKSNGLIKITLANKEVEEIPKGYDYRVVEDYLIFTYNSMVHYTKMDIIELNPIPDANTNAYFSIIEIDGNRLLRIFSKSFRSSFNFIGELKYYDFELITLFTAWKYESDKNVSLIGDNYFVIGTTVGYDYVSSLKNYDTKKYEVLTEYLSTSNILYKVSYQDKEFKIENIFEFPDNLAFETGEVLADGKIIFYATYVKRGSQLFPGGVKHSEYLFDPQDKSLTTKFKKEKPNNVSSNFEQGIECGNDTYYFESVVYGPFMGGYYAYYLYKYNKMTKQKELMQFFALEHQTIRGLRYSEDFWHDDFRFNKERFLILNY